MLFQKNTKIGQKLVACLVTAVWACWLTTPAPFISTSTDRTREWPPLTCRSPASLSLMSSVPTDRWDWSLISLQTGETDLWYPYRQVRLITGVLTDRWDRCLYSGTQSLIVVPGHCHNALKKKKKKKKKKKRIGRDAIVLDNRRCVWCSCSPWVCICKQSAWGVRREWRTVRVVGNSGRYCGTWAVGLTPPLRRSPRVLTAGMLNAAFASESARFLFSSSRQWTTFPSASSVSTIDRLFAPDVTSTSLHLEGRPATDRRRRLHHGSMHTYITIHLYTPIYTNIHLYIPIYTYIYLYTGPWVVLSLAARLGRDGEVDTVGGTSGLCLGTWHNGV